MPNLLAVHSELVYFQYHCHNGITGAYEPLGFFPDFRFCTSKGHGDGGESSRRISATFCGGHREVWGGANAIQEIKAGFFGRATPYLVKADIEMRTVWLDT
jgi:hypothetical protein